LKGSERQTLTESIIAYVLNRLKHQLEVRDHPSLEAELIKVLLLEVYKAGKP
jgi:hypothetical protein